MLRRNLPFVVGWLYVLCLIDSISVAQTLPMPDPIGNGGSGGGGTGSGGAACGCQMKLLSPGEMSVIGPNFFVKDILTEVKPPWHTADPAEDEWDGNDELYRIAKTRVEKLTPTSGVFGVTAIQGFEIYDSLPGTDPGFPANHVHPSVSVQGEFEFKTNSAFLSEPVGIILDGNVTAVGSASIHGSVAAADLQLFYHADAGAGASMSVESSHPFPDCPGGAEKIKENITINGSVNTETAIEGSVSITIGTTTKSWKKKKEQETTTDDNITLGLMHSVTLADTAFNGSASFTGTLNISGSTDSTSVRIPVAMIATATGSGTADGAYSIGNGSAAANVTWSGTAMPCAMPDPNIFGGQTPTPTPIPPMPIP